ncbi:MAG: histone family protein [Candidatus Ranarchaeia archaeon]
MPRDKKSRDIPIAPLDRLIRKVGVERVSEGASFALGEILESIGKDIAERSKEIAAHTGRKTITEKDIRLAYSLWRK